MSLINTLREVAPKEKKVVTIDIETAPMLAETYTLWPKHIPWKNVKRPTRIVSITAKPLGGVPVYSCEWDHGREALIETSWRILDEADVVVGWNSNTFDTAIVNREAAILGFTEPSPYHKVDVMRKVKSKMKFDSHSLGFVVSQLGVGTKLDIGSVPDLLTPALAGDEEARRLFRKYNINDVVITEAVFEYLRSRGWIHSLPHLVMDGQLRCPQCGSLDLKLCDKPYQTKSREYEMYQCLDCFGYVRDSVIVNKARGIGVSAH